MKKIHNIIDLVYLVGSLIIFLNNIIPTTPTKIYEIIPKNIYSTKIFFYQ